MILPTLRSIVISAILLLTVNINLYAAPLNWQQVDGLYGFSGQTLGTSSNNVIAAPNSQKIVTLYTFDSQNGFFSSTNNGKTWKPFPTAGISFLNVMALQYYKGNILAIDINGSIYNLNTAAQPAVWTKIYSGPGCPNSGECNVKFVNTNNTLYGFQAVNGYPNYSGELISSLDGLHWSAISTTAISPTSPLMAFTAISNDLYLLTAQGLYQSTNNGVSWPQITSGSNIPNLNVLTYNTLLATQVNGKSVLFLGAESPMNMYTALYYSDDNGKIWSPATLTAGTSDVSQISNITSLLQYSNTLYLMTSNEGLFTSTDGTTWTSVTGLETNNIRNVSQVGPILFLNTEFHLYQQLIGTATWTLSDTGISAVDVYKITAFNDGTLLAATKGDLYRSTDSKTWAISDSGLTFPDYGYATYAADVSNSTLFIFREGGANAFGMPSFNGYTSTNEGASWQGNLSGPGGFSYFNYLAASAGTVYGLTTNEACQLTNNNWNCFTLSSQPGASTISSSEGKLYYGFSSTFSSPVTTDLYEIDFTPTQQMIKLTGNLNTLLPSQSNGFTINQVVSITSDTQTTLYAATSDGLAMATYNPSSMTWKDITPNVQGAIYHNISSIIVNGTQIIAAAYDTNTVLISNDSGNTWTWLGLLGLNGTLINQIAVSNGMLYAATSSGLYSASYI